MKEKLNKGKTEEFDINRGVTHGDSLSCALFNLMQHQVLLKINKEKIRRKDRQIMAQTDVIVLIVEHELIMQKMLDATRGKNRLKNRPRKNEDDQNERTQNEMQTLNKWKHLST